MIPAYARPAHHRLRDDHAAGDTRGLGLGGVLGGRRLDLARGELDRAVGARAGVGAQIDAFLVAAVGQGDAPGVGEAAKGEDVLELAAGNVQAARRAAGGQEQGVVGRDAPVGVGDGLGGLLRGGGLASANA